MPDNRGLSLTEKHHDKLRREKETNCLAKLAVLVPHIGPTVHALALEECGWDEERAVHLLRAFQADHAEELKSLAKSRKRIQMEARNSDGCTSSNDNSSLSRGGKKHRKRSSSKKTKKKDAKKHKRHRVAGKKEYGRYGVLRETDLFVKKPEFTLWALEVKGMNLENLPKYEEKRLFRDYMEDYNTATLPKRKYYDLDAYHRKKRGRDKPERIAALDDEAERKRELQVTRAADQAARLRAAYDELKSTDKAEDMKKQQLLRAQLNLAYRTGDREKATQLQRRLAPDNADGDR